MVIGVIAGVIEFFSDHETLLKAIWIIIALGYWVISMLAFWSAKRKSRLTWRQFMKRKDESITLLFGNVAMSSIIFLCVWGIFLGERLS